jgi:polyhydroxyalkanoate synthase subunit PhaC
MKGNVDSIERNVGYAAPMDTRTISAPARIARRPAPRAVAKPADSRERGDSLWLGQGTAPSAAFLRYQELERSMSAWLPVMPGSIAPATAMSAFMDWWVHLATSPAKQRELIDYALELATRSLEPDGGTPPMEHGDLDPMPQDKRFLDPLWRLPPYAWLAHVFLLRQQWWQRATTGVPGVTRHHEEQLSFAARQWLDMVAPSNFISASPVVQRRTLEERGANLLRGAAHAFEDAMRELFDYPPAGADTYRVGVNMAVTPGRVVMRNRLIELIQYEPTTRTTHPEPVLLVSAWIMKYYVLDLTPRDSLVKYLVDRGYTVFAISWKNPDRGDRDLGFEDYYRLGVREALDAIGKIVPSAPAHLLGYCLGGTLTSIATAAIGRERAPLLKTLTLLAAQTDFTDPGELSLFVDESQVAMLENRMWRRGYLDKSEMKSTFRLLRSTDLIWSYRLLNYLLGQRQPVNALMAWNADGTRMPFRMHSEYLRALFLRNELARGELHIDGAPINLDDIRVPIFNLATVQDHVAPWRSVYKLHGFTNAEQTFVLAAGGHNVGVVNPPGASAKASYRIRRWKSGERLLTPDEWLAAATPAEGSWWAPWVEWLDRHSSAKVAAPPLGAPKAGLPPLEPAPGLYVLQR